MTLMMFDLDHFKSINDRFGHATGDDVLKVFASSARSSMRADDIIARFGGEEFAAIVSGPMTNSQKIAERIRAGFEAAGAVIGDHKIGATVSIGAACAVASQFDIEKLLSCADAALYRAKSEGRNCVRTADDSEPDAVTHSMAEGRSRPKLPRAKKPPLALAANQLAVR